MFSSMLQRTARVGSIFLVLYLFSLPVLIVAQSGPGSGTKSPPEVWDAKVATSLARVISLLVIGCYFTFCFLSFMSYLKFKYFIHPTLAYAKLAEYEKVSRILSFWPEFSHLVAENFGLFVANFSCWFLVIIGFTMVIGASEESLGSMAVFAGTVGSGVLGAIFAMPNHPLGVAPSENQMAKRYQKVHPPILLDHYYVMNENIYREWNDRPEAWTFEIDPWGPYIVSVTDAHTTGRSYEPRENGFTMPPAGIDVDELLMNRAQAEADAADPEGAEERKREEAEKAKSMKASFMNLTPQQRIELDLVRKMRKDELLERQEKKQKARLEYDSDDESSDEEEVGLEFEINEEEEKLRRQLAAQVDPDYLVHLKMDPVRGVCSVFGNYPLPVWQKVSYFEVYIANAYKWTTIVVGITTRPYPHWRFPGWHDRSAGIDSKGNLYISTTDFEKKYCPTFGCHASTNGMTNVGPHQRKVGVLQEMHFDFLTQIGQMVTDEETLAIRRREEQAQKWDCIGVMYNRETGRIRFTVNGELMPPSCHMPGRLFYPCVSADGWVDLRINFGSQPFRCTQFNYLEHGFGRTLVNPRPGKFGSTTPAQPAAGQQPDESKPSSAAGGDVLRLTSDAQASPALAAIAYNP